MIRIDDLKKLGFAESHELVENENAALRFKQRVGVAFDSAASVYAWTASHPDKQSGTVQVLYVGKAGRGIDARLRQHEGGFTHSCTGRSNAALLREVLRADARVSVFVRRSDTVELFGATVSLYAAEEDALCRVLKPSFNRADFPNA